jgi:hypothetical protein
MEAEATYQIEVFRRGDNVAIIFPNSDLLETGDGRLVPAIMVSANDAIQLARHLAALVHGLMADPSVDEDRGGS